MALNENAAFITNGRRRNMERVVRRNSVLLAVGLVGLWFGEAAAEPAGQPPPDPARTVAEATQRTDWKQSMLKRPTPKKGCFTAIYPQDQWQEVPCVKAPAIPMIPRQGARPFVVGNGDDIAAQAPTGFISQAIGHFDSVTNVTSVSSPIGNAGAAVNDAYTLQVNTNPFASTACAGSPNTGCQGWEQFVYYNDGSSGVAFIQYWLLRYNATCPAGQNWNQFSFTGSTDIYCWKNAAAAVAVPNQPIANMSNWTLSGTATATADSVTMATGTNVYTANGDNAVAASAGWTMAEFNIFGAGGSSAGGGQATFNAGASAVARTQITYGGTAAPNCVAQGFTGETNNLSFGPTAPAATQPGPAVIFQESIAGGASSNCAAAVTVGDTHLRTFEGLFYDFQASGDFSLAVVDPDFEVQTRQVSGAPTWPNASVNSAVAARFGKTEIAICLAQPRQQPATLYVDRKPTEVKDGETLSLQGVGIQRRGDVYQVTSDDGDSVRVTVNPTWLDVDVGLGRWPSTVRGLIANANGNINQIATRDGRVLTNPFDFGELYGRFADSWRVSTKESMLSACGGERVIAAGAPKTPFFANDLEPAIREKARGACIAAGVKQGVLLDACTLDVAVAGDDAAANVFVGMAPPAAVGTIACTDDSKPSGGATAGTGGGIAKHCQWLLVALAFAVVIIVILLLRRKK